MPCSERFSHKNWFYFVKLRFCWLQRLAFYNFRVHWTFKRSITNKRRCSTSREYFDNVRRCLNGHSKTSTAVKLSSAVPSLPEGVKTIWLGKHIRTKKFWKKPTKRIKNSYKLTLNEISGFFSRICLPIAFLLDKKISLNIKTKTCSFALGHTVNLRQTPLPNTIFQFSSINWMFKHERWIYKQTFVEEFLEGFFVFIALHSM